MTRKCKSKPETECQKQNVNRPNHRFDQKFKSFPSRVRM